MINKNHITFLSKKDKILKKIIEQNKKPQISKSKDYVLDLCKYIIFQQISTKAGISIFNRFINYYNSNKNNIPGWNQDEWKKIGISNRKKTYIENVFYNQKQICSLKKTNDPSLIRDELIKIKGIGNWTIDMFLIFSKNNLDIFPDGDLALINVIKTKYHVESIEQIIEIANKWSPYKTIAALYLWESLGDDFPN